MREAIALTTPQLRLTLLPWAATMRGLEVPDRDGHWDDIVLGFDDDADYRGEHPFLGATVGRFANRIAGGRFELDGVTHRIPLNDGSTALHGGPEGFFRREWSVGERDDCSVTFHLESPAGDMGFPGRLSVTARFSVEGAVVRQELGATTDAATVVNLTNHAYFNLHGRPTRSIADHRIRIDADSWLPVDPSAIPLAGAPAPVAAPYDLREPVAIGSEVRYDHTWMLSGAGPVRTAAVLDDPCTGRRLRIRTTEPGVQFYSGDFLDGSVVGKGGVPLERRSGLCLETQHFPDSPNRPDFPSTVLRPGETFQSLTEWSVETTS
ncbi:MAG: aldose epimerase family protein [Nocardioides sp.]